MNCTSTARNLSAYKHDQIQNITGTITAAVSYTGSGSSGALYFASQSSGGLTGGGGSSGGETIALDASRVARTGNETTPLSTSYKPRLHF